MNKASKTYKTTYRCAVGFIQGGVIQIPKLQKKIPPFFDKTIGLDKEKITPDQYTYYVTELSEYGATYIHEHFGLKFAYSNLLECWILVDDTNGDWSKEIKTDLSYAECI